MSAKLALLSLVPLLAGSALADDIRAPASTGRNEAAGLPSELAGLYLGELLDTVRVRLEGDGWSLRTRPYVRRGIPVIGVMAKSDRHPDFRRLQLQFHSQRLVGIAAHYHRSDTERMDHYAALCRGHEDASYRDGVVACVDRARTRVLEARGLKVEVIDLGAALATRLITHQKVDRRLLQAKERRKGTEAQPRQKK